MSSTTDSYVQVANDGTGKKIRNMAIQVLLPDGTIGTTYMQVVSLADEFGNILNIVEDRDLQQQQVDELRAIRIGIQNLLDAGATPQERCDLLESAQDYYITTTEN